MSSSGRKIDACLLVLALSLASCTWTSDSVADETPPAPAHPDHGGHDAAYEGDEPATVPPATVPHAAAALAPLSTTFEGYGPVPFGAEPDALREAWSGELDGSPAPADPAACYYLFPQPRPAEGHGTAFMVEGGRFVRVDVDQAGAVAPGGGRIGMDAAEVVALYPGQVEEQPHKYVEGGAYLRIAADQGPAVLVFEVDPDGAVGGWRVGLPPQVDYVEGCG